MRTVVQSFSTCWEKSLDEAGRTNDAELHATNGEGLGNSGVSATQPAQLIRVPATGTILQSTDDEFH